MQWNEAQRSAIETRGKNILVSAAAGSGKTAVLTERIKRLVVDEGVGIDEMLIVTFTNAAASEMKERIYKGICEEMEKPGVDILYLQEQLDRIGSANISTFHSFCLEIIRDFFYLTELNPDFKVCDTAQSEIFAQEAMEQLFSEFFEDEDNEAFLDFLSRYSSAKNERAIEKMIRGVYRFIKSLPNPVVWLDESIEALKDSEDLWEKSSYEMAVVLRNLVVRYDEIFVEKKISSNQVDFGDIEHLALKILESPEACNEYRDRFKHIFIDEYQDTNGVQEELIGRIKREDNLFMVGDVKQSIYQFRQADPQIFIDKYQKYREGDDPNSIKIDLNRNFRSKPVVIDSTNCVMKEIMSEGSSGIAYDEDAMLYAGIDYENTDAKDYMKCPVQLDVIVEEDVAQNILGKAPELEEIQKAEIEAMFVSNRIKEVLGTEFYDSKTNEVKNVNFDDIVVLMRSFKSTAQIYQDVFKREGIPAYVEGNDDYFETVEISIFINLIKVIVNMRQDIPLISVLHSVIFGFSVDELSEIRIPQREGLFAEAFIRYCDEGDDEILREKCRNAYYTIRKWKDESGYISLRDFLWKIAEESGFYDFIRALPLGAHRVRNLKKMIESGEKYQKNTSKGLAGFQRYMEQLEINKAEMGSEKPSGEDENFVRLMSVHKSKGLEFPVVIVSGLGKKFNFREDTSDISMERSKGLALRYRAKGNEFNLKTARQEDIKAFIKSKAIAEEMRILYVAMTRARDRLFMMGTVKKLEVGELPGEGKIVPECATFLEWISEPIESLDVGIHDELKTAKVNVWREYPWDIVMEEAIEEMPEVGEQFSFWKKLGLSDGEEDKAEKAVEAEDSATAEDEAKENSLPYSFETEEEIAIRDEVYDRMSFRYEYSDAATVSGKYTATELNRIAGQGIGNMTELKYVLKNQSEVEEEEYTPAYDNLRKTLAPKSGTESEMSAAERGTLTHKVLEFIDMDNTEELEDVEAQLDEMLENGRLSERERKGVRADWIHRFFASDLGKRMKSSPKVNREKQFLLMVPYDDETGSIVQGVIDCFFEEDGEIVLLDYKTDYLPSNAPESAILEKAEKYRTQMSIYRDAIEEATGMKVKEGVLYLLSIGKTAKVF